MRCENVVNAQGRIPSEESDFLLSVQGQISGVSGFLLQLIDELFLDVELPDGFSEGFLKADGGFGEVVGVDLVVIVGKVFDG